MKFIKNLLFFVFIGFLGPLQGQDIHFSLFNMSPLTLNPAQTGAFYGTARVGGIYRDQWASFLSDQFVTPSFYVDAPIIKGFGKKDWVGVGAAIFNDRAGTSNLRNTGTLFSAAYHMAMNKKATTVLTLGVQGGSIQRRIDIQSTDLLFEDEIDVASGGGGAGVGNGTDRMNINENTSYFDLNAGLMLRSDINDGTRLEVGLAFGHILTPDYFLISNNANNDEGQRPLRTTAHARLGTDLSDKFRLTPGILFQATGGATEVGLQTWGGLHMNEAKDITLNFGAGYRFGDAAEALLGVDYKDIRVALAYDINVSSLNEVSDYQGGFEIAAYYIIKIFKTPKVKPAILCPKF